MKKFYVMLASVLLGAGSLMAQTVWQTQNYGTMQTDTLYHVTIGPGTTETRSIVKFSTTGNAGAEYNATTYINVVEVDLTNPYVTMKVAATNGGTKNVKTMMSENTRYGRHYFAGVNGDFLGGDGTCTTTIADGIFKWKSYGLNGVGDAPKVPGNSLIIGNDGKPSMATKVVAGIDVAEDRFGFIEYPSGVVEDKLRHNGARYDDYVVVYDKNNSCSLDYAAFDEPGSTCTNQWGLEAEIFTDDLLWGGAECTVGRISTAGNMGIPKGGYVLSAVGGRRNDPGKLASLKTGDKVKVGLPFEADGVQTPCRETIGGYPRLVVDGQAIKAAPTDAPDPALNSRRARTAVGYNKEKTKMYLYIVEEGKTKNQGMTAKALAGLMQAMGCHEALNLDGGGSSLLYVENLGNRNAVEGVMNGYTRPVANALCAVCTAPDDGEVARIEFVDKHLTIKPGRGYQPVIYAYNKYGALISAGLHNYTLSASEAKFDASARKMIAPESGKFALTAEYKGIKATIPVYVDVNGVDGTDPASAPAFKGNEFVTILPNPNPVVDPSDRVDAVLEDVTPEGYDFDKYEVGTLFPFTKLPESPSAGSSSPNYLPPVGIYSQDKMDQPMGQISVIRSRGVTHENQYNTTKPAGVSYADQLTRMTEAFSIQKHPVDLVGNCLVFSHQFGVGYMNFGWSVDMTASNMQLTFYADGSKIKGETEKVPVRVRLVFQVLHRGRHAQDEIQISSIVGSAVGNNSTKPISHNGENDYWIGANYPIDAQQFYRWENEGMTIAEMPEEKILADGMGKPEFWDGNNTTNPYLINGERFMVYEFDAYGKPQDGTLAVNVNITVSPHNTYVFKEIKFFNVLNGEELLGGTSSTKSRAANIDKPFVTTTANGSLLGTRSISYRYYTPEGIKEIEAEQNNAGIDDVVVDIEENDAPVEYYNLQGIKVENPAAGIYIKRQGSKATKILIR